MEARSKQMGLWRFLYRCRYYLFLFPALLFLGVFVYYPIAYSLIRSFQRWDLLHPQPTWTGWGNYQRLIHDPVFWTVIKNSLLYVTCTIFPTMVLALFFAILIDERVRGRAYYIYSLFYPTLIPMAAAAMLWVFIYSPNLGLMNIILVRLGLPRLGWLGSADTSLWALIIMSIWKYLGFYTLIYLSGLQNLDKSLYESAFIDGAGWWRRHFSITVPLVAPTSLFIFIVGVILSFRVFAPVHLMTEGGPGNSSNVIIYYIYENGFKFFQLGIAFALTVLLVVALLLLVLLIFGFLDKRVTYSG